MPVNTKDEQGIARCNPLFLLLRRVIACTACDGKSWKQLNKRKDCAWHLLAHHDQCKMLKLLTGITAHTPIENIPET